jgi:hypothetical protein
MREHTHLPAMVGFVRKHVAQHFETHRPRPSPAVSAKLLDAAPTAAERFREHLRAANGALGQSGTRASSPQWCAPTRTLAGVPTLSILPWRQVSCAGGFAGAAADRRRGAS